MFVDQQIIDDRKHTNRKADHTMIKVMCNYMLQMLKINFTAQQRR